MAAAQIEVGIGNLDKVIDLCDGVLKTGHGRYASSALTLRGQAYAQKGDLVLALQDFEEAVREDRRNVEATVLMLLILMKLHLI